MRAQYAGYIADNTIYILPEFEENAKLLQQEMDLGLELLSAYNDTIRAWGPEVKAEYYIIKTNDRVILYPTSAKPKGWTWGKLMEVTEATGLLITTDDFPIKTVDFSMTEDRENRRKYEEWKKEHLNNEKI